MRLFTCTDHATIWPVGGASIVIAEDELEARHLLSQRLSSIGLNSQPFTLTEIDITQSRAIILCDGVY